MIVTRFVRVCGARGWFGVLRQVMKATERTFFLDGRARVDRYSHRKWCLRGPQQVGRWSVIVAKIGRKPGIPALRVTGKGLGCIRSMIVSVCSAFWLFLREIVLIDAKSGGKATVCTVKGYLRKKSGSALVPCCWPRYGCRAPTNASSHFACVPDAPALMPSAAVLLTSASRVENR